MNMMNKAHLELAKQLIELKYNVKVETIEFEDGSGKSFNVTTTINPLKKRHVRL
jgi:hypothetical protein